MAVMADSSHSLTVCLTLLPQCYDVRKEKQHLQDLIIQLIGMCQLLFKYI